MPMPPKNSCCVPVAAALLAGVAAVVSGCHANTGESAGEREAPLSVVEQLAAETEGEPIGMGHDAGIELHWWLVDDTNAAVARALSSGSLAELTGSASADEAREFDPAVLEAWRTSGLRVYSLPPGSFATLQRRLPPRRAWERVWLGQPTEWRELVAGRSLRRGELIQADGMTLPVPPGRLRLLVRAWLTPDADRAAIHLELLPQIAQRNPALTMDPLREVEVISELKAGRVFDALHLHARLIPGRVYLIVPAAPDEDWDAAVRAANRAAARDEADAREPVPDTDTSNAPIAREPTYEVPEGPIGPSPDLSDLAYGPDDRGPLSLGEAAFVIQSGERTDDAQPAPRRRMVIVILPRSPGRFGLLP